MIPRISFLCLAAIFTVACAGPNRTGERVAAYRAVLSESSSEAVSANSPAARKGAARFQSFLKNVGDPGYVSENAGRVYAPNAYLNDTLKTHHGREEISAYFVKLNRQMKDFSLKIDDVARSGDNVYVRWRMSYKIPGLRGNSPIETIGMSQARFNSRGEVLMQQDFWDSAAGVYEHIPLIGGVVGAGRD